MATAVPMKGGTGRFAVDKCNDFIEEMGDREGTIIVKTDQEPSIEYLIKGIVEQRPEGRTIVEEAALQGREENKGGNGIVERAVQEVEGGFVLCIWDWRTGWGERLTPGRGSLPLFPNIRLI